MLKRKIDRHLEEWKENKNHKPLIIKGCRQCGKTSSVLAFAKKYYKYVVYLNFFENPHFQSIFQDSLDIDYLTMMMSALLGDKAIFKPGETIIIFDEIQECPQARTSLKFFKVDGRYDVIGTGSLLGIKGYREMPSSIPVGYETVIEMYPMDFEEFLWANGITDNMIDMLRISLKNETPVAVLQIQRDIVASYKDDMIKYASNTDKAHIRECFESIPKQLSKENKKFQYSVIKKGSTASRYMGSLQWIEDAGIITRCYNLSIPELPLDGNAIQDVFKVYMCDTGLFISMLEDGTQFDVLNGHLYGYKGAIFENLIADIFHKMGRKLYYYHKDSGLEIDFVMRYHTEAVLVEVKATTGNTKSTKTILNHPEKYHIQQAIKLGQYNVGREGKILTLPTYMAFLLTDY